ncbi:hypothetical protein GCM10018789_60110 [Streptomyces werraensis]|nr:hypothetical protein GCM10018789_60110 [Streptomyces werraensis]
MIPERADQQADRMRRGQAGGRPPPFDREAYKQRNTVEQCINRLKQRRGVGSVGQALERRGDNIQLTGWGVTEVRAAGKMILKPWWLGLRISEGHARCSASGRTAAGPGSTIPTVQSHDGDYHAYGRVPGGRFDDGRAPRAPGR